MTRPLPRRSGAALVRAVRLVRLGRLVRLARVVACFALAALGLTCRDRGALTGPGLPAEASLAVQPVFPAAQPGGPTLRIARVRGVLTPESRPDSVVRDLPMTGDSLVLEFQVTVLGQQEPFRLRLRAFDAAGAVLFEGDTALTISPGTAATPPAPRLRYVANDAGVVDLVLTPDTLRLLALDTARLSVTALDSAGATVTPVRLGWTSRDTLAATVDSTGRVRARSLQRATWIVAQTATGVRDSVPVFVTGTVGRVVVTPDTATLVEGDTLRLSATVSDSAGTPLLGRRVVWFTLDTALVAVDTMGLVRARLAGTARVVATSGAAADTSRIRVEPGSYPIGSTVVTPDTLYLQALGDTGRLAAQAYDTQGRAVAGSFTWTSRDTTRVTVDASGLVTARADGATHVVAREAGGTADSTYVVVAQSVTTTRISPRGDTVTAIGDTVVFTARSWASDSTVTLPAQYTWTSRDTSVLVSLGNGAVASRANGSAWLVVADTGGTSDSAHVLVQQRAATVTITPSVVQRYLGTSQQFAAAVLDSRGVAIPGARVAWGSTNTAIATIDSTGLAQMVGLGTDTITASVDGVVARAVLTVVTAISRIDVTPAADTLVSLGETQSFSAVAYDTLGVAMTGISFAWSSSNPSVAGLSGITATGATATAAANGYTAVRASAQGVTGRSDVNVRQVLASASIAPTGPQVAPGGYTTLVATGFDARGNVITGATFSWSSSNTGIATVNQSGTVAGVAIGTATITATGGNGVQAAVTVTVSNDVPAAITFGTDTLRVGRGGNISIPIYLSTPPANGAIITLTSANDSIATFGATQISFPAGVTQQNVTLYGHVAGITTATARDSSGQYGTTSVPISVRANAAFNFSSFSINANDQRGARVVLSDPAPSGGLYITYAYDSTGIVEVSPDPAFVPSGQLSSDVIVRGLRAGTTGIRPTAPGVTGTRSSVTVYAANLTIAPGTRTLGAGQMNTDWYVYTPTTLYSQLDVALGSTDTIVARASVPSVTIPSGSNYRYFTVHGRSTGRADISASATGWNGDTDYVIVTTPRLALTGGGSMTTTSSSRTAHVYTQDSAGYTHYRIDPLYVTARSTNDSVLKVIDTSAVVQGGTYYATIRVGAGGTAGTASLIVEAAGHPPDTVTYTVTGPKLSLSWSRTYPQTVGAGQRYNNGYVYIPDALSQPLVVRFAATAAGVVTLPDSITIPAGQTYSYFSIRADTAAYVDVIASATGYEPDTASLAVTTPRVVGCCSRTLDTYGTPQSFTVYTQDSLGYNHPRASPLTVTLESSDTNVVKIDSATVTVQTGYYYVNTMRMTPVGAGTARIRVSAPGHGLDSSLVVTVRPAKLSFSVSSTTVGQRQYNGDSYVYIPNARTDTVRVVMSHGPLIDAAPDTVLIPPGHTYRFFQISGLRTGTDSVRATSADYVPDTVVVRVTTPHLLASNLPSTATTLDQPYTIPIYTQDSAGRGHYTMDTVTLHLRSTDTTVLVPESTYVHVPRGQNRGYATVRYVGVGSAALVVSDSAALYRGDTTNTVTVSGPSLFVSEGQSTQSPMSLGVRQRYGSGYVYVSNPVEGSPLWVKLKNSDTAERVAMLPDSIDIPVGSYYRYFTVTSRDTIGLIQVTAEAAGYSPVSFYVNVSRARFYVSTNTSVYTTTPPQSITVYATDSAGYTRAVDVDTRVRLASSNASIISPDSVEVTIPAGQYYVSTARLRYGSTGTASLTASDTVTTSTLYPYLPDTVAVTVSTPPLYWETNYSTLGLGQRLSIRAYIPNPTGSDTRIGIAHRTARTTSPTEVTIAAGQYYSPYVPFDGVGIGPDTITASVISGVAHSPSTTRIVVDSSVTYLSNWRTSMAVGDSVAVRLYSRDFADRDRVLTNALTFTFAPTAGITVLDSARTGSIGSITIGAGQYYSGVFWIRATAAGTQGLTITATGFRTNALSTSVATSTASAAQSSSGGGSGPAAPSPADPVSDPPTVGMPRRE